MSWQSVFIVGMMGSGKSTVGRRLADVLGLTFVDADRVIEERAGADIGWIFDVEEEDGFREREEQVLDALSRRQGIVLATGGGAVLRQANRQRLHERGVVVYLRGTVDTIVTRTRHDRRRPLLQGVDARQRLTDLLEQRTPLYEEVAHVMVDTDEGSAQSVAERVHEALRAYSGARRKPS